MDLREIPASPFQRHPWELSRLRFFSEELRAAHVDAKEILDAGAGDAWFSRELGARVFPSARIACLDSNYSDDQLRTHNAERGQQTFSSVCPPGPFDLLLALDVIEHVEDDVGFLRSLVATLAPSALALISVPAWQALFSSHDVRLRHFRRYTPRRATQVLEAAGLEVVRSGGLFHGLLVPRGAMTAYERLRPRAVSAEPSRASTWHGGRWATRAVEAALGLDNRLSRVFARRGLEVPGLSWWALCRRRS